jgi:hypothetical protein
MYGFLILLPLTLISLLIGFLVASSTQVADYIAYISHRADPKPLHLNEIWSNRGVLALIGAHVLAYAVLCFTAVATVRTVSAPLPADRAGAVRFFQVLLETVFVAVPSSALLWIMGRALIADNSNPIHWATLSVLCVGIAITVGVTVMRRPLELYTSSLRPFSVTKVDAVAVLCLAAIGAAAFAFAKDPIESAHVLGMFPVLMLATATAFLTLAAIFSRAVSPVAVISSLMTTVLIFYLMDWITSPTREFRYTKVAYKAVTDAAAGGSSVADIKAQRKIPDLVTAFRQWLEHRRPAIEAYKKKGRAYPVFLVTAQGGGIYAAYHPALSLARLTDHCPEFAHHLFAISSVSGGSLGAAVYAELVRALPPTPLNDPASPSASCTPTRGPTVDNYLQTQVQRFFETDFLTPVIASAFIFDAPSIFIPQLRFGQDRARALEFAFEAAWKQLKLPGAGDGLSAGYFGRWDPAGRAPALFMSTTAVNFGIPILVAQVDWSYNPVSNVPRTAALARSAAAERSAPSPGLVETVRDRLLAPDDQLQVGVGNLLDFRPDIQMATSTAVVLSARFPFVTPPAAITENSQIIKSRGLFNKTKVLELTDGAFYDNSGGIVARDIIAELVRRLENDERLKEFKNDIKIELIRFTDTPAKRQGGASDYAHSELITPLVAYDAVRQSRGVLLTGVSRKAGTSNIYLLDEWYDGSLNWLLSEETKRDIETRSSWLSGSGNVVCCEVRDPVARPKSFKRIPLSDAEAREVERAGLIVRPFVPNARQFLWVLGLVDNGAEPTAPIAETAGTPLAVPQPLSTTGSTARPGAPQ